VWPGLKWAAGLAIVGFVGRQFYLDYLRARAAGLGNVEVRPAWVLASGALYLLGIGFSALYWRRLLGHFGPRPRLWTALRAYYLGHLGKYVPGKAWALFLRANLVRGDGVRLGLGALTAFYEVLVTMSASVLLAAVLFALTGPDTGGGLHGQLLRSVFHPEDAPAGPVDRRAAAVLALGLFVPLAVPVLPPVFNRIVGRVSLPFREGLAGPPPRWHWPYLLEGWLLTGCGWLLLGGSLAAALCAIRGPDLPWTPETAGRVPAIMGVSYVAGFVIVFAPSGLGVREYFLELFLTPELAAVPGVGPERAAGVAVLAVVLLRVVWTASEAVMAAVAFPLAPRPAGPDSPPPAGEGVS
jgi:hypothetical protein